MIFEHEQMPGFSAEDFAAGNPTVFAWIYERSGNKWLESGYIRQASEMAKQYGVRSFAGDYRAYRAEMRKANGFASDNTTRFENQPIELMCGIYTCDDDSGVSVPLGDRIVTVCEHPIMPVRRIVNVDSGETQIEIAYRLGSFWRKKIFPKEVLSTAQQIVGLSRYGINVTSMNAKELAQYIAYIEQLNYELIDQTNSVGRLGWIKDYGFSPYCAALEFDGDINFKHIFESVTTSGSEGAWMELARETRSGTSLARLLLAASFASPLIEPLGALPFVIHLWGGTEAGKTVALLLAASVWANPALGKYCISFNSTNVGLEMIASFLNSTPLCVDEYQTASDKGTRGDNTIYKLCEGIGRLRGAKAGGLQRVTSWHNCTLTTGETPITSSASGGGAVNRIISIDCRDEKLFADGRKAANAVKQNYGFAGKKFVQALTETRLEQAKELFERFSSELASRDTTEKQTMAAALILTADTLAEEIIFHDGKRLSANDIAEYLSTKSEVDANRRALQWLSDLPSSNPERFYRENCENRGECWGTVKQCGDGSYIAVVKSVFDRLMSGEGYNSEAFLSWAKRRQILKCSPGRSTFAVRLPGSDSVTRCAMFKRYDEDAEKDASVDKFTEFPAAETPFAPEYEQSKIPF